MNEPLSAHLDVVCDGQRLAGGAWVHPQAKGVIVFVHGMPSAGPPPAGTLAYPDLARLWAAEGWVAVWGDLRSVRESSGYFSIEGWVRDVRALIDASREVKGAAGLPVAVVATSAGGAVATEAIRRGAAADALVLLAAPAAWLGFATSPRDAATRATEGSGLALAPDVLQDPGAWAAEFDGVATERSIASVSMPTLIVHGTADAVVPVGHARRIAARSSSAELWIIEGAEHNLRYDRSLMNRVQGWLRRVLGAPGASSEAGDVAPE